MGEKAVCSNASESKELKVKSMSTKLTSTELNNTTAKLALRPGLHKAQLLVEVCVNQALGQMLKKVMA